MWFLIIILIICYLFYSQCAEKPVKGKKYIILPIILILIGYIDIRKLNIISNNYLIILIILCITFLIIGLLSGIFIKFYRKDDGILYEKGGLILGLFLIGGIVLKELIIRILAHTQYSLITQGDFLLILLLGFQFAGKSITAIFREHDIWIEYIESKKNKE